MKESFFFIVNSKEKGVASEISLYKDLIDMKTRSNHLVRVLKPSLFVLVCYLIELYRNLKVYCLYLFLFSKLALPDWECGLYLGAGNTWTFKVY